MAGSTPDPNCTNPAPAPPPPRGRCSGELRVRGSVDGSHFLGVGFSCPDPHQAGDCHLMLRPVKGPDAGATPGSDSDRNHNAGARAVTPPVNTEYADGGAADSVVVPFSPAAPFDGNFNLRVLVDTSVVEVYAQTGRAIETIQCPLHSTVAGRLSLLEWFQ